MTYSSYIVECLMNRSWINSKSRVTILQSASALLNDNNHSGQSGAPLLSCGVWTRSRELIRKWRCSVARAAESELFTLLFGFYSVFNNFFWGVYDGFCVGCRRYSTAAVCVDNSLHVYDYTHTINILFSLHVFI